MNITVGQYIEFLDEEVVSYNYKNRLLAEIVAVEEDFVRANILMHPNTLLEGTEISLLHDKCYELTNKVWEVYQDHLQWRKFGRAAYEYHPGDIIKCSISLELYYVTEIDGDIVTYRYFEDNSWVEESFECSNASFCPVVLSENRVDTFFGEKIL